MLGIVSNFGKERKDVNYLNVSKRDANCLNISKEELEEGPLDLEGFTNLEVLICSGDKLTSLTATDCSNLRIVDCRKNLLTKLDLSQSKNLQELKTNQN